MQNRLKLPKAGTTITTNKHAVVFLGKLLRTSRRFERKHGYLRASHETDPSRVSDPSIDVQFVTAFNVIETG